MGFGSSSVAHAWKSRSVGEHRSTWKHDTVSYRFFANGDRRLRRGNLRGDRRNVFRKAIVLGVYLDRREPVELFRISCQIGTGFGKLSDC